MPLYRTVNGRLEPVTKLEFFIQAPTYEADAVPSVLKENNKHRYIRAYVEPEDMPAHPHKWRGPRLRNTHRRPSRVPRRYRVNFNRITP